MARFDCINVAYSFCGLHVKMKKKNNNNNNNLKATTTHKAKEVFVSFKKYIYLDLWEPG